MELILLFILIGWLSSLNETADEKAKRLRLEEWRRLHPNWQDVL